MNKELAIVLCGVGGQGTVLASKTLAACAMKKDMKVMSAETIGMAQRGGSVFSHVRIGDGVYCPMIKKGSADMIIAFEPGEAVRMLPYLKEDGAVIVSTKPVMPVTASLAGGGYEEKECIEYLRKQVKDLKEVDTEKALGEIGSPKVLNVLLLGAALSAGVLPFSKEEIYDVLCERLPEKLHELNRKALFYYE